MEQSPPPPPQFQPGQPVVGTEPMAVIALVVGLASIVLCAAAPVALGGGILARVRIRDSMGTKSGKGMATAGIVLGLLVLLFWIGTFVVLVVLGARNGSGDGSSLGSIVAA